MKRPACVIGMCLMLTLRMLFALRPPDTDALRFMDGMKVGVAGTVDDKYIKHDNTYLILDNPKIISGEDLTDELSELKLNRIKIKLKDAGCSLSDAPKTGSEVTVRGRAMAFPKARNPGNFDTAEYELIHGTDLEVYDAKITSVTPLPHTPLRERICLARDALGRVADRIYGETDAQVIKAMTLGDRNDLSDELKSGYRRAGMSHILCISGLHISFLGMGICRLLKRLGMRIRPSYAAGMIITASYGVLTGLGVSTVRALIMFALMMAAEIAGRTPDLLSSVSVAAVAVMLWRPVYVLDAGFVLSFAAVAGIGVMEPAFRYMIPLKGRFFDALRSSLAVTVFMLPLTMYYFFCVPLCSVPVNLLAVPLAGILLISAVISLASGAFCIPLGIVSALPARLILWIYSGLIRINDAIPHSRLTPGRPAAVAIVFCYTGYIALALYAGRQRSRRKKMTAACRLVCAGVLAGSMMVLTVHIRMPLEITMLDVGQGDCHFMLMPDGRSLMIDCGSGDVDKVARYRVVPCLMSMGCDSIDYAVVTHTDEDHMNGYLELMDMDEKEGIRIRSLILPDIGEYDENGGKLIETALRKGVRVLKIHAGESMDAGDVELRCLNPALGRAYADANETSVCLDIRYRGFRALYTGDAEGAGEQEMMERIAEGRCTLLKCAHHGSRNSTPAGFLKMIRPACTFISAGEDNRYGHPHKELMERLQDAGSRVYVTKELGAVRMSTDGKRIKTEHYVRERRRK